MARSPAQREASRRFMEAHAPDTRQDGITDQHVDPMLAGKRLGYRPLGLVLEYKHTFTSRLDGERYIGGVVVDKVAGCGVMLGSVFSLKAKDLEVIG